MFRSLRASGGATRRNVCEAIQRPGAPVQQGWIASSQGLLAMTSCGPRVSPLALRAPERRAPVLRKPPHDAAAAGAFAFLALAIVDLERVLEIAELAGGLAVIAQRRAAGLDRLVQHSVNCLDQPFCMIGRFAAGGTLGLLRRQRRRKPPRRQMRPEQRLADIDIAEPGDDALVEQRSLQAGLPVGAGAR